MTNDQVKADIAAETTEHETLADMLGFEGGAEGEQAEGEAAQVEPQAEAKAEEKPKAEEEAKPSEEPKQVAKDDEAKRWKDKYSQVRDFQVNQYRMLKALEDDGFLDRDEIAGKVGMTRGEVDRLLDSKPTAAPGEPEYQKVLFQAFDEEVKKPSVVHVLKRAYGNEDALNELKDAYVWATKVDPIVSSKLDHIGPDEVVAHVFDTGKEYLELYREAKKDGVFSPLDMWKRAKQQTVKQEAPAAVTPKRAEVAMPTLDTRIAERKMSPQEERRRALLGID
jgi:hypothetical protein